MIKIIVFDDDPEVRYGIYDYLKKYYEIYITKDKKDVFKILNQTNINLVIFDYSLVNMSLNNFIDKLKEYDNKMLIITLSAKINDNAKKVLFNSKIDDYMNKPLDMQELQFRIDNLLRKQSSQFRKFITTENLIINCETNSLLYKKKELIFLNKEFQILYHLFSYPNRIFSKNELIELICDMGSVVNENTIRTYINTLRRKLKQIDELEIVTIRGIGYKGIIKNSSLSKK